MKIKAIYERFIKWLPAFLLILIFATEAFSKYSITYFDGKSEVQRLLKLIVLAFFVISILKPLKNLLLPTLLLIIFCLGQFFLPEGFTQEIVVSFSKYLFPIFLFIYFNKHPLTEKSQTLLFRTFEFLLIINGVLIFLGLIFELPLFNSYRYGRWGYNGFIINTSTSSYVYAIALFYFLLSLKENFLKSWKTYFIIICCLLTGTKIVYIALFGSLLLYFLNYTNLSRKQRNFLLLSIVSVFMVLGYIFFFQWGIFNEIRKEQGLLSAILSYRDDLFIKETIPFIQENWQWPNYLFGGISNLATRSQMGFIDVFLFWGAIGGLVYLYTFYKTFVPRHLIKNAVFVILILTLMVFLAGNFFENASVAIYLLILKEIFIDQTKSFHKATPMTRIEILNTTIDNLSMQETLALVQEKIRIGEQLHHVVVNAGKVVAMQKDSELRESVNQCHIINADGQAVVWASRFLGKPLKERVAGIDLMASLVEMAHKNNNKIFLFGAKEEIVKEVVSKYSEAYSPQLIAGYRNGYFTASEEEEIAQQIADSGTQMLFVAISSPIKENFLYKYRDILKNVNLIMGVGGSFDVVAGKTKRAPQWMQNAGLEWFYRFAQEPKRMWKRYLVGNSKFIYLVLKERFSR